MLKVEDKKLCSLCFSELMPGDKSCRHCEGIGNIQKYATALSEGTVLAARYVVGKVLGKGGFGLTYLCYDWNLKKKVAIKEFFPDSIACRTSENPTVTATSMEDVETFKTFVQKFYDEAKLVSKFNGNPNIISVYEFFFENNTAYFVMEALNGMDLKHYITTKGGRLDAAEALYIVMKVLDALMIVHSTGVLHRDISPDNIYICSNGDIKLIDFGAARQVIGERSQSLSVILKQGFAPIEQYQKKGVQGPWTDIYALGATLYYTLSGKMIDDAMSRIADDELADIGVSGELMSILRKMVAVKREERYQSVFEVKMAIEALNVRFKSPIPESYCISCGTPVPPGKMQCERCSASGNTGKHTVNNVTPGVPKRKKPVPKLNISFLESKKNIIIIAAASVVFILILVSIIGLMVPDESSDNSFSSAPYNHEGPSQSPEETKYQNAMSLWNSGKKIEACKVAMEICGYKDTQKMITQTGKLISAGCWDVSIGCLSDGSVITAGNTSFDQRETGSWNNVVAVAAGGVFTAGLKADGTAFYSGYKDEDQHAVQSWFNIQDIAAGRDFIVGLTTNGTVMAAGDNDKNQLNVSSWSGITQVAAGYDFTVGLKSNGTVVAIGNNNKGQCDVSEWTNIVAISAGYDYTLGLKSDGTVVAAGDYPDYSGWTDIVAISAGNWHMVGLKKDGTVMVAVTGLDSEGQSNVQSWTDMVAVSAGGDWTLGIKSDGTVLSVGDNDKGQCDVADWYLK